jgi:hypothetical protein
MPATAKVTVLGGALLPTPTQISVDELSRIVNGGQHLKLFQAGPRRPLDSGVWIRVRIDTILELDQQYQP